MAKPTKQDLEKIFDGAEKYEDGLKVAATAVASKKASLDEAVEAVSIFYDEKPKKVKTDLSKALENEPAEDSEEQKAAKADAEAKAAAAAKAAKEAADAAETAKKKAAEAASAAAAAEGKVSVRCKKPFILMIEGANGQPPKKYTYGPNTTQMPRDHAEHWFSKANGVDILG